MVLQHSSIFLHVLEFCLVRTFLVYLIKSIFLSQSIWLRLKLLNMASHAKKSLCLFCTANINLSRLANSGTVRMKVMILCVKCSWLMLSKVTDPSSCGPPCLFGIENYLKYFALFNWVHQFQSGKLKTQPFFQPHIFRSMCTSTLSNVIRDDWRESCWTCCYSFC